MDTKKLRQKILDLAIHGKLVPQDPNDEPASVLLERIRAEKERLKKEGKIRRSPKTAKTSDTPHYPQDVPFEVPDGWEWCKLDDTCQVYGRIGFRGYTKEDLVGKGNGAITLSPSNIVEGCMNYDKCTYISWPKYEESPEIKVENNDILLVKTGSSFGKCALVLDLPQQATINPQFVVLKSITIHNHYLTYVLQSQYARKLYDDFVLGTAIPTFTQVALGNMRIPLPPLAEQQRIVAEIERWFALIDTIEQGKVDLQTAIKQTKSKILDLAIHGKLVPQDPNDEPAIELLRRINPKAQITCDNEHSEKLPQNWTLAKGKNIFAPMKSTKPKDKEFQYIDIDSIDNRRQIIREIKTIQTKNAPSRASRFTQKNDVVFSMVRPYLRNIAKVANDNCIASTGFYVCSSIPQILNSDYCYYLMTSDYVVNGLNQFMKGDNSPSINKGHIDNWLFALPPLVEQQRIVQKIEELFSVLDNIQEALQVS